MGLDARAISRNLSQFLLVPAGMALLSLPVCLLSREWFELVPFALTIAITGALSLLLHLFSHSPADDASIRQTFVSVALGWGLVCGSGALPLWLSALLLGTDVTPTVEVFRNGLNALFEGFSGFTSAGLTMVIRPSALPVSLQWWRSFMQWVGGVGLVVLAGALLQPLQNRYVLYQAEGRQERIRLTVERTVRRISVIYTGYTVFGVLLFRLTGMDWWPALNHSMSAISTGGFSVTDGNMAAYGVPTKLSIMLMMILGAIAFSIHDHILVKRNLSALLKDRQHFLLIGLLVVGTAVVGIEHYAHK